PPELTNLGYLQHLHLSENQLTGSIPPELVNLGILYQCNLSSNRLKGESLRSVYGSQNHFQGESPTHCIRHRGDNILAFTKRITGCCILWGGGDILRRPRDKVQVARAIGGEGV
ncbi:unnamed protein product, partial [Ectocarpus sp. 8 AP-2014]